MVTVIKSLADTYKEESKRLLQKCELYELYINALEKHRAKLKEENTAYKILLKNN